MLFSHGISSHSQSVYERLQNLHPAHKNEVPVNSLPPDQFKISAKKVRKALIRSCSETWKSLDSFGWTPALLHLIQVFKPDEGPSFFDLSADFISKRANCEMPDLVAFIYTTESLLALNKDSELVKRRTIVDGLSPRERPINQGTMFLKLAFDLAVRSREAQEAAKSLAYSARSWVRKRNGVDCAQLYGVL